MANQIGLKISAGFFALSGLLTLGIGFLFGLTGAGFLAVVPADAGLDGGLVLGLAIGFFVLVGIADLVLAWFLLKQKPLARTVALVFSLLSLPLGLIPIFFLFFDKETKALFESGGRPDRGETRAFAGANTGPTTASPYEGPAPSIVDRLVDPIKSAYYWAEDLYYAFLDWLNQYVPVYALTDPIDRVVPSFVLLIVLFILGILFLAGTVFQPSAINVLPPDYVWDSDDPDGSVIASPPSLPVDRVNPGRVHLDSGADYSSSTGNSTDGAERAVSVRVEFLTDFLVPLLEPVTYSVKCRSNGRVLVDNKRVTTGADTLVVYNTCPGAGYYDLIARTSRYPDAAQEFKYYPNLTKLSVVFRPRSGGSGPTGGGPPTGCGTNCTPGIHSYSLTVQAKDNATNQWIAGAFVQVDKQSDGAWGPAASGVTAGNGVVQFATLPQGHYRITTSAFPQYGFAVHELDLGASTTYTALLTPAATNKKLSFKTVRVLDQNAVNGLAYRIYLAVPDNPILVQSATMPSNANQVSQNAYDSPYPYYVAISDPAYQFVAQALTLRNPSDTGFDIVQLSDAVADDNIAHIVAEVVDVGADPDAPIEGARIFVQKEGVPFFLNPPGQPILSDATGHADAGDALNLPSGNYRILVQKTGFVDAFKPSSTTFRTVDANEYWFVRVEMEYAKGNIQVNVKNPQNQPVAGAKVTLFNHSNQPVGLFQTTGSNGSTVFANVFVNQPVYARIEKTGFLSETTIEVQPVANETTPINVFLTPVPAQAAGLVLQYLGLFTYNEFNEREPASVFEDGASYFAEFKLVLDDDAVYSNTRLNFFTPNDARFFAFDPNENPNNPLYAPCLVAPGALFNAQRYYSDYNPLDPWAPALSENGCGADTPRIRTAQADLSTLAPGVYHFEVNIQSDEPLADDTPLQLFFSARTNAPGPLEFNDDQRFGIGNPTCDADCPGATDLQWEYSLVDTTTTQTIALFPLVPEDLPQNSTNKALRLKTRNAKNKSYVNASVRLSATGFLFRNPSNPNQQVASVTLPVSSLGPYAQWSSPLVTILTPPSDQSGPASVIIEFVHAPAVDNQSSPKTLLFNVLGSIPMTAVFDPEPLFNRITIKVREADSFGQPFANRPIAGARVFVDRPASCTQGTGNWQSQCTFDAYADTDANGNAVFTNFSLAPNTRAVFKAEKNAYRTYYLQVTADQFNVGGFVPENESCIIHDNLQATRPRFIRNATDPVYLTSSFRVLNNCPQTYKLQAVILDVLPSTCTSGNNCKPQLSPDTTQTFTIAPLSTRDIGVTVRSNTPQGVLPIGLVGCPNNCASADMNLQFIAEFEVYDDQQTFEVGPE